MGIDLKRVKYKVIEQNKYNGKNHWKYLVVEPTVNMDMIEEMEHKLQEESIEYALVLFPTGEFSILCDHPTASLITLTRERETIGSQVAREFSSGALNPRRKFIS